MKWSGFKAQSSESVVHWPDCRVVKAIIEVQIGSNKGVVLLRLRDEQTIIQGSSAGRIQAHACISVRRGARSSRLCCDQSRGTTDANRDGERGGMCMYRCCNMFMAPNSNPSPYGQCLRYSLLIMILFLGTSSPAGYLGTASIWAYRGACYSNT